MSVYKVFVVLLFGLLTAPVSAGQFDMQRPILCAIQQVDECNVGEDCSRELPQNVSLPDFFRIDLVNKKVTSTGNNGKALSPIKSSESIQDRLILQGGDSSGDKPHGGIGWTLTLNEQTGKMTLAGVADGFAMAIFGACIQ